MYYTVIMGWAVAVILTNRQMLPLVIDPPVSLRIPIGVRKSIQLLQRCRATICNYSHIKVIVCVCHVSDLNRHLKSSVFWIMWAKHIV